MERNGKRRAFCKTLMSVKVCTVIGALGKSGLYEERVGMEDAQEREWQIQEKK